MTEPLRFPEYGQAGDPTAMRRGRRTFRFFVLLCLTAAVALWMSENYLRYDLGETQYRAALIHHPASARPILRKVVSRDAAERDIPNVRYVEALALVEEDDRILPAYAEAFRLNSNDPNLLVKYGVELYQAGQYRDARERFREAGIEPPENALPHFLETAAMVAAAPEVESLAAPLDVLNDANPDVNPVLFPAPLWHTSWPRDGAWYWDKQRSIIDRCLAPIYRLVSRTWPKVAAGTRASSPVAADWLAEIEAMGAGLVGTPASPDEELGLSQAMAGLTFQHKALALRLQHAEEIGAPMDASASTRLDLLSVALDQLKQFDELRQEKIALELEARKRPLTLALQALLILGGAYVLASIAAGFAGGARNAWGLRHPTLPVAVLVGVLALQFILLWLLSLPALAAGGYALLLGNAWFVVIACSLAFVLVYPSFALPGPDAAAEAAAALDTDAETLLPMARRARVLAHFTLLRRYSGILLGGLLCVYAAWFVSFRVVESYYPYQVELLVSAHRDAAVAEIRSAQSRLN